MNTPVTTTIKSAWPYLPDEAAPPPPAPPPPKERKSKPMAQKYSNRAKATVWADGLRSDIEGNIAGVVELIFCRLKPDARAATLELLRQQHDRLKGSE